MFAGSEHVFIAGQPKFVTINGEYNSYNQETTTYNVNSNNIIGNSYTETITDNSQTFYGRSKVKKGRMRTQHMASGVGMPIDDATEIPNSSPSNTAPSIPLGNSSTPSIPLGASFTPSQSNGFTKSKFTHNGYTQTFGNQFGNAPLPSGIEFSQFESTDCKIDFNIKPGDIMGMGAKSAHFFQQLFSAIEEEHYSPEVPQQTQPEHVTLASQMSMFSLSEESGEEPEEEDDDNEPAGRPFRMNYSERPPSISDAIFSAAALHNGPAQPNFNMGVVNSRTAYNPSFATHSTQGPLSFDRQSYSPPVAFRSHIAQPPMPVRGETPIVAGMAGLSLEEGDDRPRVPPANMTGRGHVYPWPAQDQSPSFASPPSGLPPQDAFSSKLKNTIFAAASMPDNNATSQPNFNPNVPRIETSSSTQLHGPPAVSFSSTLIESPTSSFPSSVINSSPPRSSTMPMPVSTVPHTALAYRQATIAGIENVTIAPGAHVTSMIFEGSYTEVSNNHRTINHGISGLVTGNSVVHVRNTNDNIPGKVSGIPAGKEQSAGVYDKDGRVDMECDDEKTRTSRPVVRKQGRIPAKGKKWSD